MRKVFHILSLPGFLLAAIQAVLIACLLVDSHLGCYLTEMDIFFFFSFSKAHRAGASLYALNYPLQTIYFWGRESVILAGWVDYLKLCLDERIYLLSRLLCVVDSRTYDRSVSQAQHRIHEMPSVQNQLESYSRWKLSGGKSTTARD